MRLKICTRYDEEDARNMFGRRRRRLHNNKYIEGEVKKKPFH